MRRMTMVRFHPGLSDLMESITAVQQHPDNPNNGDIEAIAESMEVNGVFTPVIAQRSTGYILAGNHRYAALLSLGQHRIPVVWVDVDDTEALRILFADNRTAQMAVMDNAALAELLEQLNAESEIGLLGTGYTEEHLEHLRSLFSDPDPEPEVPEEEEYAKQRASTIRCPNCGHTFGGEK